MVSYKERFIKQLMGKIPDIVAEKKVSPEDTERVLEYAMTEAKNHKREPKPPAPLGGITVREAGRKYDVCARTISGWVKKGLIPVLRRTPNWLYVDEATLSELIQRYKRNPGQGKKTVLK